MTADRQQPNEVPAQHRFMEQLTAAMVADYRASGGQIYCGRGCSNCCTLAVNCTLPEAQLLAGRLEEELLLRVDRFVERLKGLLHGVTALKDYLLLHRQKSGGCPLLGADGACQGYEVRPLSCRALLATKESYWCGADFAGLTLAEKKAFVESLDPAVTAFPLHYLAAAAAAGRSLEQQALLALLSKYGFSLYGNMPVLVHLLSRRGLAEALPAGVAAVRALLHRTGLDHPLLVTIEEL